MENIDVINRLAIITNDEVIVGMTPAQIYDRVMADSLNNEADWEFPMPELFRVISMKEFPRHYAKEIEIAIINHFSSLEESDKFEATNEEYKVIDAIYSRLLLAEDEKKDELMISSRKRYLKAIIEKSTILAFNFKILPILQYENLKNKWIEEKLRQYENIYGINFPCLLEVLVKEFREYIEDAYDKGLLLREEEVNELEEKNRKVLTKILIDL